MESNHDRPDLVHAAGSLPHHPVLVVQLHEYGHWYNRLTQDRRRLSRVAPLQTREYIHFPFLILALL